MPHISPSQFGRSISADNPPPSRPAPVLSTRLDVDFSLESETLGAIAQHGLPRVVKCDSSTASSTSIKVPFSLSQPLLVHSKRSVTKVGARSVIFDRESGRYVDTGDDILVPEDYPGWFGVLGPHKDIKMDLNIPYHRNVGRIGIANCRHFLVGGTSCIKGFTRVTDSKKWEQFIISPGEVLRKVGMYEERKLYRTKSMFGKQKIKEIMQHYLRCSDIRDREILLPANQDGVFYMLAEDGASIKTPVLPMSEILKRYRNNFPIVVKLVYGPVPKAASAFKDTLLLTEAARSHTVIASTMENLRNINLEIPLDNGMKFFAANHSSRLTSSRQYLQAIADCEGKAPTYKKNMKVLVDITPDRGLPLPPNNHSLTESVESQSLYDTFEDGEHNECQQGSPVSLRDKITIDNNSSRMSRMSVISRIITLNGEEQSIFAPRIPSSANNPGTLTSPKGSQRSSKSKIKEHCKNTMPGDVIRTEEFEPPQDTETISGVNSQISISAAGRERRKQFLAKNKDKNAYEEPKSLFVSTEEPIDSDIYGSVWQSSSINRRESEAGIRASGAGIKIESKPGRPITSQSGQSTKGEMYLLSESDTHTLNLNGVTLDHVPQGIVSTSVPRKLPSFDLQELHSILNPDDSVDGLGNIVSSTKCESVPNNQPQYKNILPDPAALPTQFVNTYHAMGPATCSNEHVYNELNDDQNNINQELNPLLPFVLPSVGNDKRCNQNHTTSEDEIVSGGYLTPLDTKIYASHIEHEESNNHYESPKEFLFQTAQMGSMFAFYEFHDDRRDSGIYEEKVVGEEDRYDKPTPSMQETFAAYPGLRKIYDERKNHIYSSPTLMSETLQHCIRERTERMHMPQNGAGLSNVASGKHPGTSSTGLCNRLSQPPPQPPPLPKHHPGRMAPSISASYHNSGIPKLAPSTKSTSNRDALLEELKKTGLKASSELAIQSLQVADLTMLSQRSEDLDDVLTALLPKVGLVDLCKIAMCIKRIGIRFVDE